MSSLNKIFLAEGLFTNILRSKIQDPELTPGVQTVLMILYLNGSTSQSNLCRFISLKPAAMSMLLKKMEQAGFVGREIDPVDKRAHVVSLTGKGLKCAESISHLCHDVESSVLKGFSGNEAKYLETLLDRVYQRLDIISVPENH